VPSKKNWVSSQTHTSLSQRALGSAQGAPALTVDGHGFPTSISENDSIQLSLMISIIIRVRQYMTYFGIVK